MPKKKVRFIDPTKSISFKLQNRSQRDPLCVDPDAPQHVLVPMGENVGFSDLHSETTGGRLKRWSRQKTYGVRYEDGYDYLQHLRIQDDEVTAQLTPMDIPTNSKRKALGPIGEEEGEEEEEEEQVELMRDDKAVMKLPPILFPSEIEAEESLLTRGNSAIGPRPDWDPDIVAALDDDFKFEDPEEGLEDGLEAIVAQMCTPGEGDEEEDVDSRLGDFDSDDLMSDEDEMGEMMDHMERKSRFSSFSMSSAFTQRSEGLRNLDERFEQVLKQYENGNGFGQDDMMDEEEEDNNKGIGCEDVMRILGFENMEKLTLFPETVHESVAGNVPNKEGILAKFEYERDHDEDLVTIYKKVPAVKHDAVSILSTYSNIYNRPKLIEMASKPKKKPKKKPVEDAENETKVVEIEKAPKPKVVAPAARDKNETSEEKRARKQAVKEGKKVRRQEKKATKTAFQTEKTRRQHEVVNIQKNLQGIKL